LFATVSLEKTSPRLKLQPAPARRERRFRSYSCDGTACADLRGRLAWPTRAEYQQRASTVNQYNSNPCLHMTNIHELLELGGHSRSHGHGRRLVARPHRPYGAWGPRGQVLAHIGHGRATTACLNAGGSRGMPAWHRTQTFRETTSSSSHGPDEQEHRSQRKPRPS